MAGVRARDPSVAQVRASCGLRPPLLRSRGAPARQLEADIRICEEFLARDRERAARASSGAQLHCAALRRMPALTLLPAAHN
jgi:hypothetical protein